MIEQLRQKASGLFSSGEDRGVSPVIGVILMVAITVILAAVIGAFVMGLGDDLNTAPQANLEISHDNTNPQLVISHSQGDRIEVGELRVVAMQDGTGAGSKTLAETDITTGDNPFSVGDTITIDTAGDLSIADTEAADYEIRIIHTPSDSLISSANVENVQDEN